MRGMQVTVRGLAVKMHLDHVRVLTMMVNTDIIQACPSKVRPQSDRQASLKARIRAP